jgi:enterobactin synthetase component F
LLCDLFAEILGVPTVSIDDNFFDLGGYSLLAARLASRIQSAMGRAVSVRSLFEAPTVVELARLFETGVQGTAFDVLLPLRASGAHAPIFCIHPVGGLSWCYSGLLGHLDRNYPVYGLQSRGFTQPDGLPATVDDLVEDYLAHIRTAQPTGPYYLLGWSFGGAVAHAIAVRLQQQGEQVSLLAMLDSKPFNSQRPQPQIEEHEILAHLAHVIDGIPTETDHPWSVSEMAAALREEEVRGGLLADFDEQHLRALIEVYKNSATLESDSPIGRFEGNLVYFQATQDRSPDSPEVNAWEFLIGGAIDTYEISCSHQDMVQPGPIAHIGLILAKHLHSLDNC